MTADARDLNETKIRQLHQQARALTSATTKFLSLELKLAIGALVVLTYNLEQRAGLCNGSKAHIYDIIVDPDAISSQPIVLVKMSSYRGPSFVKGVGGAVPITAKTVSLPVDKTCIYKFSRTALPLRLGFATTIHKVQGQTCSKVIFNPTSVNSSALAYVALSRVRRRNDITLTKPIAIKQLQKSEKCKEIDTIKEMRIEPIIDRSRQQAEHMLGIMQLVARNYNMQVSL